jgi:hypothetical protein
MRIMALVLVAALAACFVTPVAAYRGNPDRSPYPVSRFFWIPYPYGHVRSRDVPNLTNRRAHTSAEGQARLPGMSTRPRSHPST